MAKTPFEIRLDLLHLAQSILSEKNWAERNRLEQNWNALREMFENDNMSKPLSLRAPIPQFPTLPTVSSEDIIAEAKKLNDFVSNG